MGHNVDSPVEISELQNDLNSVYLWTENNNMQLNEDKFEHLHYSGKPHNDITPAPLYISSSGVVIEEKEHVEKDQGINMSNTRSLPKHVAQVISDATKQTAWVLRTFATRDVTSMLTLSKALVQYKSD